MNQIAATTPTPPVARRLAAALDFGIATAAASEHDLITDIAAAAPFTGLRAEWVLNAARLIEAAIQPAACDEARIAAAWLRAAAGGDPGLDAPCFAEVASDATREFAAIVNGMPDRPDAMDATTRYCAQAVLHSLLVQAAALGTAAQDAAAIRKAAADINALIEVL